jgi:VWFA-related protein
VSCFPPRNSLRRALIILSLLLPVLTAQEPIARVPVRLVIAPTSVTDQHGKFINGLAETDFALFDNDVPQKIHEDADFLPISLVVAIQNNHQVGAILPKIHELGPLLGSLVVGEGSEAAILTFHKYVETIQSFTGDPGRLTQSLHRVECHYDTNHLIDATLEGIHLLKNRPPGRRRILLLISEKRDLGSESKLRDIIEEAELNNVLIYSMNISRAHAVRQIFLPTDGSPKWTAFTLDIIALIKEIYSGVKNMATEEPLSVLTRYTGGREYSFFKEHSFEQALGAIGEEIHGQYLLSYSPSNVDQGGYHSIRVALNRPELTVRSRPGYYTLDPATP